jgi:hypothetical protein
MNYELSCDLPTSREIVDEVVRHPSMSLPEKRALLSSWISDWNSVPDDPRLRRIPEGQLVDVDYLFQKLRSLDGSAETDTPGSRRNSLRACASGALVRLCGKRIFRRQRDDDDNPPPSPAQAAFPPRPPMWTDASPKLARAA